MSYQNLAYAIFDQIGFSPDYLDGIGATDVLYSGSRSGSHGVSFRFPATNGVNYFRVNALGEGDEFDVVFGEFFNINDFPGFDVVERVENVPQDQLVKLFEDKTCSFGSDSEH